MYNAKTGTAYLPSTPPTGSVMAFLGTDEPDGWIFANGVQRTNVDGRYNSLLALDIGTGSGSSYTPPDLKGAFLRGAGIPNNSTYSTYQGETTVGGIQTDHNKPHRHSINRSQFVHGHGYLHKNLNLIAHHLTYSLNSRRIFNVINGEPPNTNQTSHTYNYENATTGNAFEAQEYVTTELSSDSGETRPYNYSVNWIIKL